MTPAQIYAAPFIEADNWIGWLVGCYYTHVPEVADSPGDLPDCDESKRIEVRTHAEIVWDGRRQHILRSVWLDGHPIMICVNAGREGDDHKGRWITDEARYIKLLQHLNSIRIVAPVGETVTLFADKDEDFPAMTDFYGENLSSLLGKRQHGRGY